MCLPAEELDIPLVVGDNGPLVDQWDGEIFCQVGGVTGHEGGAGPSADSLHQDICYERLGKE